MTADRLPFRLDHRRIVVTGASSGIGVDIARVIHELGGQPILIGRDQTRLTALACELNATAVPVDITDEDAVSAAIAELPPLDGLVNCAGISILDTALEAKADDIQRILATNVTACAVVTRECAKRMIADATAGSIVNVSSQAASVALSEHLGYCASKAAMDAMTRVLCLEWGPQGIRVNSVNPTVTLTPMAEMAWSAPEKRDPMLAAIPLRRFATPREVALPVAFLLSDAAAMISGISLPIDGGYTCH
ncbi:SDR family oxidoreductase [Halomonas sp. DP5Y7-2]|uniref:SDR family oxidoreductase n=1 Tax=Halomonas sp. DP5Y7-2 TaxID=2859076 RepID=UPI001C99C896|nr:SDR family oxidoreductase [Halomonas sp. DP5Y7-2]MBY5985575.1 SDR family oxidoreductase [Halomonas sp. DP5Y7-2]